MAGLQRSTLSYRREGSSGAVWSEKLLPELVLDQNRADQNELRHCHSVGGPSMAMNHRHHQHHQTVQSSSPSSNASSSNGAEMATSPSYMNRSSSLSVSALKLLNPKLFGRKFKGIVASNPPKYGKQLNLVRA